MPSTHSSRLGGSLARATAIATMAAAFVAPVQADLVWDSYGTMVNAFAATGYAQHSNAQVFSLSRTTNITSFVWDGVYLDNAASADTFTIDIYGSVAGTPTSAPLLSLSAGGANRMATGSQLGAFYNIYDYAFGPAALTLGAGDYFFSVNNAVGNWFWGVNSTSSGSFFVRDNLGPWDQRTSTLNFRIEGTALPEPASLALVGISLLGLLATRRRRPLS